MAEDKSWVGELLDGTNRGIAVLGALLTIGAGVTFLADHHVSAVWILVIALASLLACVLSASWKMHQATRTANSACEATATERDQAQSDRDAARQERDAARTALDAASSHPRSTFVKTRDSRVHGGRIDVEGFDTVLDSKGSEVSADEIRARRKSED